MAIIEKTAPNGTVIEFDTEKFSEEDINNYLKLPEYSPQTNETQQTNVEEPKSTPNNDRGYIKDIAYGAVDGVRDGVQATIGLVEQLGDTLGEKTNIGGFAFGKDATNGLVEYVSYEDFKKRQLKDPLFGQAGVKDAVQLPDFENDPQTLVGGISKGLTQFITGWVTGGKLLKGVKATTTAGQVATTLGKGAIADFQAFDEDSGRLVDMITDKAPYLANPLFDYLSSNPNDTFYEARFKNALEGLVVGGAIETTYRLFRWYKNTKAKSQGESVNEKLLKEDQDYLAKIREEDITSTKAPDEIKTDINKEVPTLNKDGTTNPIPETPIKPKAVKKEVQEEVIGKLETDLEDKIYNQFENAQKISKNKAEFDENLINADLSLDFNLRQFIDLDKNGLLTLDAFTKATEKLMKNKRVVFSDEQVERTARRLYENNAGQLEIDIRDLEAMVKKAPAQVVAMNNYISTLSNGTKRLAILAKNDPLAKQFLVEKFLPRLQFVLENKKSISNSVANTQRLMGTTAKGLFKEIDDVLKINKEWGGDVDETIRRLSLVGDADITKILKYAGANKTWDVLNEIWINALLSNPKTHIVNTASSLMNIFIRPLEKAIGSRLGFALIDGADKVAKLKLESGRALSTYGAMRRHLGDALRYAKIAMQREDTVLTSRTKLETPEKAIQKTKVVTELDANGKPVQRVVEDLDSTSGKFINAVGKFVRIPSRFLNAEDEVFKQVVYRAELEKDVIDRAIRAGKSKDTIVATDIRTKRPITEFEQFYLEEFEKGFDEFGRATRKDLLRKAEEGTYTNEVTGIFKRISDTTNEYPILKQILPFTKTPVNLMLNVVDRTPLGFLRKNYRDDFFGVNGAERMAQARGQMAVGMALMTYASMLYREGYITGSQGQVAGEKFTKNKDLVELKKGTGVLPYAFRTYDEEKGKYVYRQFGRFDPFGTFFALVADFHTKYDQLNEEEIQRAGSNILILLQRQGGEGTDYLSAGTKFTNAITAGAGAINRNLFSKTYLKGLTDFIDLLVTDEPNKWNKWAQSKVGSYIPNVYTKFINDPFYRDTQSIFEDVQRRLGTTEIEYKYDFRGKPLQMTGTENERLVNGLFNPITTSEQNIDPVADEIFKLGVNMPPMKNLLKGDIDLKLFVSKDGQTAYNRQQELLRKVRIGDLSLDQKLQQVINSDYYKTLSDPIYVDENNRDDGGKAKYLKSVIRDYHTVAEDFLLKEADKFISTKDTTGKYSLSNSINAVNQNTEKLKLGIKVNKLDLDGLYQFSQ